VKEREITSFFEEWVRTQEILRSFVRDTYNHVVENSLDDGYASPGLIIAPGSQVIDKKVDGYAVKNLFETLFRDETRRIPFLERLHSELNPSTICTFDDLLGFLLVASSGNHFGEKLRIRVSNEIRRVLDKEVAPFVSHQQAGGYSGFGYWLQNLFPGRILSLLTEPLGSVVRGHPAYALQGAASTKVVGTLPPTRGTSEDFPIHFDVDIRNINLLPEGTSVVVKGEPFSGTVKVKRFLISGSGNDALLFPWDGSSLRSSPRALLVSSVPKIASLSSLEQLMDSIDSMGRERICLLSWADLKRQELTKDAITLIRNRGVFDVLSLNPDEALRILTVLGEAPPNSHLPPETEHPRGSHEHPAWLGEAGLRLQRAFGVPILLLRGLDSTLVVADPSCVSASTRTKRVLLDEGDAESPFPLLVRALMPARALMALRAATLGGIKVLEDLKEVEPPSKKELLAAFSEFREWVKFHYTQVGADYNDEEQCFHLCKARVPDGRLVFGIPAVQFWSVVNGTVGCGDQFDIIFAMMLEILLVQK
jgi:hypothetical protein